MKRGFKLAGAVAAMSLLLVLAVQFMQVREREQVDAALVRFSACFAQLDLSRPEASLCQAQVVRGTGDSVGYLQHCWRTRRYLQPWRREVWLEPPTYSARLRCDDPEDRMHLYAEVTKRDGEWSVTRVTLGRMVRD